MANPKQVMALKRGAKHWNEYQSQQRKKKISLTRGGYSSADLAEADLRKVNLAGVDLLEAELIGANLAGAILSEASLAGCRLTLACLDHANLIGAELGLANLNGASLVGANLSRANLVGANLSGADLSGANLSKANLGGTNLQLANLNKTNISYAEIGNTIFAGVDLSRTRGLDQAHHYSYSFIDTATIFLSKGIIPAAFLRGCGLSDLDIQYAELAVPGLDPEQVAQIVYNIHDRFVGRGIQYHSCFISYNNKDENFAKRLHDDLQSSGVRCWFASDDLKIGGPLRRTIGEQIRLQDKLLVILSENSIQSAWVGHEVEKALAEERAQGILKLFPIRLDNAALNARDDWAEAIRLQRYIGDFSNWRNKHKYKKAFEALLKDLKATNDIAPLDGPSLATSTSYRDRQKTVIL